MSENICDMAPPNRLAGDGGFKNKTLLITGGTGFLGKVLIEKMLRTCPMVNKIYVIARAKKGTNPQNRIKEMFAGPLFDLMKKLRGEEICEKVIVIPGEVSEPNLGLSEENRELLAEEVEIIYHMAASVRFDETIKNAVLLNTKATKTLLELAKDCKNLLVFAHVSTVYCHPEERVLYERTYPPPLNPNHVIKLVETMDERLLEANVKKIIGDFPNTYAFSKALAEGLVNDEMNDLPIIILRPSIVIPIWKDPLPGWTDNLGGPVALLIAAGKGILRTMYGNSNTYADFIPVDLVANSLMTATYDYMTYKIRRVYNLATSAEIKITWNQVWKIGNGTCSKIPFNWVVWYPGGFMTTSKLYHTLLIVLFHYLPAIILDLLTILTGNKPVLWKLQQKITKGMEVVEYYTINQWDFNNSNFLEMRKWMNETESEFYGTVIKDLNLEQYFIKAAHAIRLYVLKESDETLPTARRHIKMYKMWAVDKLCKFLFISGLGYFVVKYFVGMF